MHELCLHFFLLPTLRDVREVRRRAVYVVNGHRLATPRRGTASDMLLYFFPHLMSLKIDAALLFTLQCARGGGSETFA